MRFHLVFSARNETVTTLDPVRNFLTNLYDILSEDVQPRSIPKAFTKTVPVDIATIGVFIGRLHIMKLMSTDMNKLLEIHNG